jgi:hypothetical protein
LPVNNRLVALDEYVNRVRLAMGLTEWEIQVTDEPADDPEKTSLEILPQPTVHWARVRVGGFFNDGGNAKSGPEEQRITVVHELLHLTQARLMEWLQQGMLRNEMSPQSAHLVEALFQEEIEVMTDRTARMLARYMPPVPDWPDD